jgi:hypothetical protein
VRTEHRPIAWRLAVDAGTIEVVEALSAAGVRSLLFKGPVLESWLYQPGERIYSDTDLLVSAGDFQRAQQALAALGFWAPLADVRPDEIADHEQLWLRPPLEVDLHRSVIGISAAHEVVWRTLSQRTEWIQIGSARLETPAKPAQAFLTALHAAYPGPAEQPFEDLRRLINHTDLTLWRQAAQLARDLDADSAFVVGLDRLADGQSLLDQLGLDRSASAEAHLGAIGPPPVATGLLKLIDTPTLAGRSRLLLTELAPSPAMMRWIYPLARHGRLGLAAAYLWRALDLCLKAPAALRAVRTARQRASTPTARRQRNSRPTVPTAMSLSSTRSVQKLVARTPAERRLLVEAALLLALTRLAVALLPFRDTARLLGLKPIAVLSDPDAAQMHEAELIGWAVRVAGARVPWRGTCLTQALSASALLHRRGIPVVLHLGVAKDAAAPQGLAAHAWVGCGNEILVGQAQQPRFTTVATYG